MRNPVREKWIESFDVEYKYGHILIKNIDRKKSLSNQARMSVPLIPDTVSRYIEAMKGGAEFPAVTAYRSPTTKKYVLIDGNHRVDAASVVGVIKLDAYIIDIDDEYTIQMMTRSANIQMGQPPSTFEAKEHAKYAVVVLGVSPEVAAQRFGISKGTLYTAIRIDEVDAVLADLGLDPEELSEKKRDILNKIKNDHPLLEGVFNLATEAKLKMPEVREVVLNITENSHNESDRLGLLRTYVQDRGMKTRTAGRSPRKRQSTKIWGLLTSIKKLNKNTVVEYGISSASDLIRFTDGAQAAIDILSLLAQSAKEAMP